MEKKWWKECVVYQIYPRSFMDSNGDGIGDLNGIMSRLEYLQDLGVNVIWLCPIFKSPNDDNGYDISDYRSIMPEFGTMGDFDALLEQVHRLGMKLMLDLVVNHSSDEHPWFAEAKTDINSPYYNYYIWRDARNGGVPNNWGSRFSGPAWEWNNATKQYYLHIFSKKQVDFNWENPDLRNSVYHIMDFWIAKGIDGFRMDVINAISKDPDFPDGRKKGLYGDLDGLVFNGPKVHEYLKEMNRKVLAKHDLITVGETVDVTTKDALQYASSNNTELNMIHNFQHLVLDHGPYGMWSQNRTSLRDLKKVFTKWQVDLQDKAWNSLFWNNHDEARAVSRFGNDSVEYRVVSAKMLATCLYFMQGTPYIYQGEELGMTNVHFSDIHSYRDIQMWNAYRELVSEKKLIGEKEFLEDVWAKGRDNCRTPMQWTSDRNAGFTNGKPWIACNPNYREINAEQQRKDPDSVWSYYKKIIALRHEYEVIVYGTYKLIDEKNEDLFIYERKWKNETLLVVCNFTDSCSVYEIPEQYLKRKILLANIPETKDLLDDKIVLSPYEAVVYLINKNYEYIQEGKICDFSKKELMN